MRTVTSLFTENESALAIGGVKGLSLCMEDFCSFQFDHELVKDASGNTLKWTFENTGAATTLSKMVGDIASVLTPCIVENCVGELVDNCLSLIHSKKQNQIPTVRENMLKYLYGAPYGMVYANVDKVIGKVVTSVSVKDIPTLRNTLNTNLSKQLLKGVKQEITAALQKRLTADTLMSYIPTLTISCDRDSYTTDVLIAGLLPSKGNHTTLHSKRNNLFLKVYVKTEHPKYICFSALVNLTVQSEEDAVEELKSIFLNKSEPYLRTSYERTSLALALNKTYTVEWLRRNTEKFTPCSDEKKAA